MEDFLKDWGTNVTSVLDVRRDLFLTGAARVCSAGATFLTAPLVISKLGIECYGMVALLTSIQAILPLVDLGVLPMVTHEFANAKDAEGNRRAAGMFRALENVVWAITLALGGLCYAGLHWTPAASDWVVRLAIAAAVAGGFPTVLYNAGLPALHRFERVTVWVSIGALLRLVGIWATLEIWPQQQAVLIWLAISGFLFSYWGRFLFWQAVQSPRRACKADWLLLRSLSSTGILASLSQSSSILLVNLDRIVLAAWLPLSQYAIYSVGSSIGLVGAAVTFPVFQVIYPRMSSMFANDGVGEVRSLYWGAIGLCSLGIGLLVGVFFAFSPETLRVILRVRQPDQQTVTISRILIAAGLLQGLRSLASTIHFILKRFRFLIALNAVMLVLYLVALRAVAREGLVLLGTTTFVVHGLILVVLLSSAHRILVQRASRKGDVPSVGDALAADEAGRHGTSSECLQTSEVH